MNMQKKRNKGFTAIIGLIISLVVVSILVALSLSGVFRKQNSGIDSEETVTRARQKIEEIQKQNIMRQQEMENIINSSGGF